MIWGVLLGSAGTLLLVFVLAVAYQAGVSIGVQRGAAERERDLRARYPLDALDQAHVELEEENRAASVEEEALRRAEEVLRRAGHDEGEGLR